MADQRWGLTLPLPGVPLADHRPFIEQAEAEGYTDLFSGETGGPDGFTPLALAAAWTTKPRLGTGIVGVFQRGPALLAQQAAALTDASSGRFVLGIGASSDRIVAGWNEIPFERPLTRVDRTVDFLRVALAGERTTSGFKLETPPAHPTPIILAALRGRMLDLAVNKADGAFTNFLPLDGLAKVAGHTADAPDGFELLCRFFCLPGKREDVEPLARFMFSSYITVPVYAEFFRWLGFSDEIAPMVEAWDRGDRQEAAAQAPWELIEQTFLIGSTESIRERLGQFIDGGITLPVITPIVTPDRMAETITALAPN